MPETALALSPVVREWAAAIMTTLAELVNGDIDFSEQEPAPEVDLSEDRFALVEDLNSGACLLDGTMSEADSDLVSRVKELFRPLKHVEDGSVAKYRPALVGSDDQDMRDVCLLALAAARTLADMIESTTPGEVTWLAHELRESLWLTPNEAAEVSHMAECLDEAMQARYTRRGKSRKTSTTPQPVTPVSVPVEAAPTAKKESVMAKKAATTTAPATTPVVISLENVLTGLSIGMEQHNWAHAREMAAKGAELYPLAELPNGLTWAKVNVSLDNLEARAAAASAPAAPAAPVVESAPVAQPAKPATKPATKPAKPAAAAPVAQQPAPAAPAAPVEESVQESAPLALEIVHDKDGSRLLGTTREVGKLVSSLIGRSTALGWTWSRQGFWYLPRSGGSVAANLESIEGVRKALEGAGQDWTVTLKIEKFDTPAPVAAAAPAKDKVVKTRTRQVAAAAPAPAAAPVAAGLSQSALTMLGEVHVSALLAELARRLGATDLSALVEAQPQAPAASGRRTATAAPAKKYTLAADVKTIAVRVDVCEGENNREVATLVRQAIQARVTNASKGTLAFNVKRVSKTAPLEVYVTSTKRANLAEIQAKVIDAALSVQEVALAYNAA